MKRDGKSILFYILLALLIELLKNVMDGASRILPSAMQEANKMLQEVMLCFCNSYFILFRGIWIASC